MAWLKGGPQPGEAVREGFDAIESKWVKEVPWGAANVSNTRRPKPYRVDAFDDPEEQATEIVEILSDALEEKISALATATPTNGENELHSLLGSIAKLQEKAFKETAVHIKSVEDGISQILRSIFPNYAVKFDALESRVDAKAIQFFKNAGRLLMGPENGFKGTVSQQGSGARRTLLWSALKYISDSGLRKERRNEAKPNRGHVLLIDEPELCLHPNAVRQACKVLYDLPLTGNWQVMVTTHSPTFIDLSRDNTTVVRVERSADGEIESTTLFRPDRAKLSEDDREELKMLNLLDPHVSEFFFGGKVILVEGDTEYSALRYIAAKEGVTDVHIIRARGKHTIVALSKILGQFSTRFAILHDCDHPKVIVSGRELNNSAWVANEKILAAVKSSRDARNVRLLSSVPNFEAAYLSEKSRNGEKPYRALQMIKKSDLPYDEIKKLLYALSDFNAPLPKNCVEWESIEQLEEVLKAKSS